MTNEQVLIINEGLNAIFILLRDNPHEVDNSILFGLTCDIIDSTKEKLNPCDHVYAYGKCRCGKFSD